MNLKFLKKNKRAEETSVEDEQEQASGHHQGQYCSAIPRCLAERMKDEDVSSSTISTAEFSGNESLSDWRPSFNDGEDGSEGFHKHAPLIAQRLLHVHLDSDDDSITLKEEKNALDLAMKRSKELPRNYYFSNNLIMVNRARSARTVSAVSRNPELDTIAKEHAMAMAAAGKTFHSEAGQIQMKLNKPSRRIGENVCKGEDIKDCQIKMMSREGDKNNIIDRRYTEMGVGTTKGADGELYLCQIFRG